MGSEPKPRMSGFIAYHTGSETSVHLSPWSSDAGPGQTECNGPLIDTRYTVKEDTGYTTEKMMLTCIDCINMGPPTFEYECDLWGDTIDAFALYVRDN